MVERASVFLLLLLYRLITAQDESSCQQVTTDIIMALSPSVGESNCFFVPGSSDEIYRLVIAPNVSGRYTLAETADATGASYGYSWDESVDGLYYCLRGSTVVIVNEFVPGSTVSVTAEPSDETCITQPISHNGYSPVEVPDNGNGISAVYWSSFRYYLYADYFGYTVWGEETVTMADGTNFLISGDLGSDTYMSIEINWFIGGQEKRFYGYFESDGSTWNMFEARVYNNSGEWEYFDQLTDTSGPRETCFVQDSLLITNNKGSVIRFDNITLAPYLLWEDQAALKECMGLPASTDLTGPTSASAFCTVSGSVISLLLLFVVALFF